mmetsp:Transcript_96875/g.172421  ORF Transcript_96875/g.172421 Transcript_96875/m.172421 type:complete len:638 (+) Transcript_96875:110-2023(+)
MGNASCAEGVTRKVEQPELDDESLQTRPPTEEVAVADHASQRTSTVQAVAFNEVLRENQGTLEIDPGGSEPASGQVSGYNTESGDDMLDDDGANIRSSVSTFRSSLSTTVSREASIKSRDSRNSTVSTTSLTSDHLTPDLRRGVSLDVALRRFGSHWSGSDKGLTLFGLSEKVDSLDDFLSHDWESPGWLKFLTLCLFYNKVPACIGAVAVGAAILAVQLVGVTVEYLEPETSGGASSTRLCTIVCPMVYVTLLLFWQSLRRRLGRRKRIVFVDKMCVNQADEAMKSEGIRSLGGFLRKSSRLVVLWSPRYFTRLWCIYEIACWLRQGRSYKSLRFLPLQQSRISLAHFLGCWLLCGMWSFPNMWPREVGMVLEAVAVFVLGIVPVYITLMLTPGLDRMRHQISNFSVEESTCHCCSCNHEDPETGDPIPCDRLIVYETLNRWFSPSRQDRHPRESESEGELALENFNEFVRTRCQEQIIDKLPAGHQGYREILCTVSIPAIGYFLDQILLCYERDAAAYAKEQSIGLEESLLCLLEGLSVVFFLLPCLVKVPAILSASLCLHRGQRTVKNTIFMTMTSGMFSTVLCGGLGWAAHQGRELAEVGLVVSVVTFEALLAASVFSEVWAKKLPDFLFYNR